LHGKPKAKLSYQLSYGGFLSSLSHNRPDTFLLTKGGNELLGIQKHTLTTLHNYTGIIFIIIALIHLILHFGWIKAMTKAVFKKNKEL